MINRKAAIEWYSSVGGAAFANSLVVALRQDGREVHVFNALDEGNYRSAGGTMFGKLWRRASMYLGGAWKCWSGTRLRRNETVFRVVTTNPFFAPALVSAVTRRRKFTINLVYDLFPDVFVQAGWASENSITAKLSALVTKAAFRRCHATVFLGEQLLKYAEYRYGVVPNAVVIPVGAAAEGFENCPPMKEDGVKIILYAGQLGRMHDVGTMTAAFGSQIPDNVRVRFHAMGIGYSELRGKLLESNQIEWGGPLPDSEWVAAMKQAQIALVTLAAGAERIALPSKTYSAMVAGQAILAICPLQSDLANLILKHQCGWIIEPGDYDGLRKLLIQISSDQADLHAKRINAFNAGHQQYSSRVVAQQWLSLFGQLEKTSDSSIGSTSVAGD